MTVTASPVLIVAGLTVPTALGPDGYAGAELSITWGRSTLLAQPTPATAEVTIFDRSAALAFARQGRDLIGRGVLIGYTLPDGTTGWSFRGRITDAAFAPLPGAVAGAGFLARLSCSSLEVDLGNVTAPKGAAWPAETFAFRRDRIAALVPAATLPGGVTLPTLGAVTGVAGATDTLPGLTAAPYDAGGKSALELLRTLFASWSPLPMIYDPDAQALTYPLRRRIAYDPAVGATSSARLISYGGPYLAQAVNGVGLNAHDLEFSGAMSASMGGRITRVEVGYSDQAASYAAATALAADVADSDFEDTLGRRTLSVSTMHGTTAGAKQLAGWYGDVVNAEARLTELDPFTYSTARAPFPSSGVAALLLAGRERPAPVFIAGSWLPQLGYRPLVGIIGGQIGYAAGQWSVKATPARYALAPGSAPYRAIGPAVAAAGVKLSQLDPALRWGDLRFIDVGVGLAPGPYPGNGQ